MKKLFYLVAILAVGAMIYSGCSSSSAPATTKTLPDLTAQSYSQIGVDLAQDITGAMGNWATTGNVTGLSVNSVKGASLSSSSVAPDADGWLHLTEVVTSSAGTFSTDLYITTEVNGSGDITDIYVYGTYSLNYVVGGSTIAYSQTYGTGTARTKAGAYHGIVTWTGSSISEIGIVGSMSFSIDSNSATAGHTTLAMTFTFTQFSVPVTAGDDYPTGTLTVSGINYNGVLQTDNIIITFIQADGTATITFGTYTSPPFPIDPS